MNSIQIDRFVSNMKMRQKPLESYFYQRLVLILFLQSSKVLSIFRPALICGWVSTLSRSQEPQLWFLIKTTLPLLYWLIIWMFLLLILISLTLWHYSFSKDQSFWTLSYQSSNYDMGLCTKTLFLFSFKVWFYLLQYKQCWLHCG